MTWTESLAENWSWNHDLRAWLVWVPFGLVLALPFALSPPPAYSSVQVLGGLTALLLCIFLPLGLVYRAVGRKVEALEQSLAGEAGEKTQSLMVIGMVQSPGVVVLRDDAIVLVPLVGERLTVPFGGIRSVREVSWLNGKKLFRKRGFYLETSGRRRIGFAVPPSVGARWAPMLANAARI